MILDVFTYCGEHRFLDARVATLADCDVEHLAVLANRSHQGDVWPVETIQEWRGHAADAGAWTVTVALDQFDDRTRGGAGRPDYQVRERAHRDGAVNAVAHLGLDSTALIALSDVDEIPNPALLCAIEPADIPDDFVLCLAMRMHPWRAEWLYPGPWLGTTIAQPVTVAEHGLQWMRDMRGTDQCRVLGGDNLSGGWHLSWWGDDADRLRKLLTFSHAELAYRQGDMEWLAARGIDINGVSLLPCDPTALDWPVGLR